MKFFDNDVYHWSQWLYRSAAQDSPAMVAGQVKVPAVEELSGSLRQRRLLVMCCEYKVIFLDLLTMRAVDVTKAQLEGRTPMW